MHGRQIGQSLAIFDAGREIGQSLAIFDARGSLLQFRIRIRISSKSYGIPVLYQYRNSRCCGDRNPHQVPWKCCTRSQEGLPASGATREHFCWVSGRVGHPMKTKTKQCGVSAARYRYRNIRGMLSSDKVKVKSESESEKCKRTAAPSRLSPPQYAIP